MSTIEETFLSRWTYEARRYVPLKAEFIQTVAAIATLQAVHDKAARNPHLTPLGRTEEVRKFIAQSTAAELRRIQSVIGEAHAAVDRWRARLHPPPPDKTDAAGAVLRSELRQMLARKSHGERARLLLDKNADSTLIAAVLEAPTFASGIGDEVRAFIVESAIEKEHPGQLAQIQEAREALELVNAARRVLHDTATRAGNFLDDRMLADFAANAVKADASKIDAAAASAVGAISAAA